MPKVLAISFHESISVKRLEQLFKSEQNQLFAGTTAAHCKKCGAQFPVFFPQSDDHDNMTNLATIENRITDDCRGGKHTEEIILTQS